MTVVPFSNDKLTAVQALKLIKSIARDDSGRVFFTEHIRQAMAKRNISRMQVIRCLRSGCITEGPYIEQSTDRWRVNMSSVCAGDRLTVVAELERDGLGVYTIAITAF